MDLFVINRYTDTDVSINNTQTDNESVHLQKLKQKIEERRKAKLKQRVEKTVPLVQQTETTPSNDTEISIKDVKTITKNEDNANHLLTEQTKNPRSDNKIVSKEFKILGKNEFEKKVTVRRILPYWLSHPYIVSTNLHDLDCSVEKQTWLNDTLKTTLATEGIKTMFPVQETVVPFILNEHRLPHPFWPHDICVSAPTGSGKTLSFVLPIIQVLMNKVSHDIRALVVLPVQELAQQVYKVFKKYSIQTGLKVALLSGSTPLQQEQKQITTHTETCGNICTVDIVVCTAGRLVEHIQNTDGFSLKNLKFLVIDEADRIMDHIQNDWLYHLDKHIKLESELMTGKVSGLNWSSLVEKKRPPHKLLFSATLSLDPEKLEQWGLFQPKLFSVTQMNMYEDEESQLQQHIIPEEVEEKFVICDAEEKPLILYHLLIEKKWNRVLCFTNSAQSGHRLTALLNTWSNNVKVAELSSSLDRTTREKVLKKFQDKEINVLIGTDALARGIDIPDCEYVISYDPPRNIKTYVHRIGRTGRAGKSGCAVTVLLQNQVNIMKELLKFGEKKQLPILDIPDDLLERLVGSYEDAIKATKTLIHNELNSKVQHSKILKRKIKSNQEYKKKNKKPKTDK